MRRPHHKVNFEDINRGHQNYLECSENDLCCDLKMDLIIFQISHVSITFAQNKGKINWIELNWIDIRCIFKWKKGLTTRLYWKHRLTSCIVTPKHQLRCNHVYFSVTKGITIYDRWALQQELKFASPQIAYMLSVRFRSHWALAIQKW